MPVKGNSEGSVYFNKQRKNWIAQYYDYDAKKGNMKRKTKTFKTQDEAKKYLDTIMYQRENPYYIVHNRYPSLCNFKTKSTIKIKNKSNYRRLLWKSIKNNFRIRKNIFW